MNEFIDIAKLAIAPESTIDIVLYSFLIFFTVLGLIWKVTINKPIRRVIISSVLSGLYFFSLLYIVPWSQSFDEETYSILLPRFDGARLGEYFGRKHFNEVLESELRYSLSTKGLDTLVEIRSISFVADASNPSQIQELKDCYNADAAIWGEVTKLESAIKLRIFLDPAGISFGVTFPTGEFEEVLFFERVSKEYIVEMTHEKFSLAEIRENIISDFMFLIAVHFSSTHLELSEKIIRQVPDLKERFHGHTYEPFLLLQAAFAFARGGDTLKAMDLYNQAFIEFENLMDSMDASKKHDQYLIPKISLFSAVSKYQEGLHALQSGDFDRGYACLQTAKKADTEFVHIVDNLIIKYEIIENE